MSLRLYKSEKLCSVTAINTLFDRHAANFTLASFPIRAFWRIADNRKTGAQIQFLISVPKKRLRHAVDRVTMRRRIREAYRLHHQDYPLPEGVRVDVAFVYVDSKLHPYQHVEKSVVRLLSGISRDAINRVRANTSTDSKDDSVDYPTTISKADAINRVPTE